MKNAIFEGPLKQFKGRGSQTGPITIVLYEDPEDKVPKLHIRCDNYMAWIQEQKLPLHLHVQRNKKISFDQWRIMSMAEFGFCKVNHGASARHDWKATNAARAKDEEEEAKRKAEEERKRKQAEAEAEAERQRLEREEEERKRKADEKVDFWSRFRDRYGDIRMGETTPPPEDVFPKVYNMASNSYEWGGRTTRGATPMFNEAKRMDEAEQVNRYFAKATEDFMKKYEDDEIGDNKNTGERKAERRKSFQQQMDDEDKTPRKKPFQSFINDQGKAKLFVCLLVYYPKQNI